MAISDEKSGGIDGWLEVLRYLERREVRAESFERKVHQTNRNNHQNDRKIINITENVMSK